MKLAICSCYITIGAGRRRAPNSLVTGDQTKHRTGGLLDSSVASKQGKLVNAILVALGKLQTKNAIYAHDVSSQNVLIHK